MIKDLEFFFKKLFFSENFLLKRRLERSIKKNYEKELSIIDKFENKSKSAVDIGVYRGIYSYKLSKQFKHVYAYEPNPLIFPYLKKNLNKIIKNLTLKNFALSNSSGTVDLKIPFRSKSIFKDNIEELYKLGCATIQENKNYSNYDSVKVNKIRLDEDLKNFDIGFIKIDVEGHEKEVIEGSRNLIIKSKPVLLIEIEEKHSGRPTYETINFICELGYKPYICKNNKLHDLHKSKNKEQENNFFFLPV
tara:strand:- start:136 stop:879 length:744 start_codon:yes stop_codon:yes gene_type:complete